MNIPPFTIRCYEKRELAKRYFPTLPTNSAVKKLRRWIIKCTPLSQQLKELHYSPAMKSFTAREVRIIVYHLGEPD